MNHINIDGNMTAIEPPQTTPLSLIGALQPVPSQYWHTRIFLVKTRVRTELTYSRTYNSPTKMDQRGEAFGSNPVGLAR